MAIRSNDTDTDTHRLRGLPRHSSFASTHVQAPLEIIVVVDTDGTITAISPSAAPALGCAPEDVIGTQIDLLAHPDDLHSLQRAIGHHTSALSQRMPCEVRLRGSDGAWQWFTLAGSPMTSLSSPATTVLTFRALADDPLAPSVKPSGLHAIEHCVQLYETDEFLVNTVSDLITAGLSAGEACVVIATLPHLADIEDTLRSRGHDIADARSRGDLLMSGVEETLPHLMRDGEPAKERFTETIGGIIERAAREQTRTVRVFGEMVAVLWAEGNAAAAIRMEELWNEVHEAQPYFSLCCAYPTHAFAGDANTGPFAEMCACHSLIMPDESYTSLSSTDARLRAISALQQRGSSLDAEIADRKLAQTSLQTSQRRYRRLFEASSDGILLVDPDTHCVSDANPVMTTLLGRPHTELIGQPVEEIGLFAGLDTCASLLRELEEKGSLHRDMLALKTLNGTPRYVDFTSTRFQLDGLNVIQCHLRDVTDRMLAERVARQNQERLRLMAESMPQKIFTATPTGTVDYLSPQWIEFTGLSLAALHGGDLLRIVHVDDVERTTRLWRQAVAAGEPYYCEHRLRRADGTYLWHMCRANPVRDTDGDITLWIGSMTDIDEQKQLEHRKNAFISMASHELKTPVTSLKGFTQILQRRLRQQPADSQVLLFVDRMEVQLRRLTNLISDLLDVSKMQTGTLTFMMTPFDLDDLVRETVENVQAGIVSHQIRVEGDAHCQITGDRDRLGQVLINLLTNAVKYSPDAESVRVLLKVDHQQAEVAVRDFGIGISEDYHARIFEQFYQVAESDENTYPGLGIGLYIARTIIARHGGRLWVESRKGEGSTFHCVLPLAADGKSPAQTCPGAKMTL